MKKNNTLEEDFESLTHAYFEPGDKDYWDGIEFAKSFIQQRDKEVEQRIGMLRQWLNEDRITAPRKMVTNEEIENWLIQSHE